MSDRDRARLRAVSFALRATFARSNDKIVFPPCSRIRERAWIHRFRRDQYRAVHGIGSAAMVLGLQRRRIARAHVEGDSTSVSDSKLFALLILESIKSPGYPKVVIHAARSLKRRVGQALR